MPVMPCHAGMSWAWQGQAISCRTVILQVDLAWHAHGMTTDDCQGCGRHEQCGHDDWHGTPQVLQEREARKNELALIEKMKAEEAETAAEGKAFGAFEKEKEEKGPKRFLLLSLAYSVVRSSCVLWLEKAFPD